MKRNPQWWVDQQAERVYEDIKERFPDIPKEAIEAQTADETWGSDTYTVNVHYQGGDRNGFVELAIHNHNRTTHIPWRHMQQIKNKTKSPNNNSKIEKEVQKEVIDLCSDFPIYSG